MSESDTIVLHWFRRDLRLEDNHALSKALQSKFPVLSIFIFDSEILSKLPNTYDRRVHYIHQNVSKIKQQLREIGSDLLVFHGLPKNIFQNLISQYKIERIYCNEDYEPYTIMRDNTITLLCKENGIVFETVKDHVIFAKNEIIKPDGEPYKVYTPYAKKWLHQLMQNPPANHKVILKPELFLHVKEQSMLPTLDQLGFQKTDISSEGKYPAIRKLAGYEKIRDIPSEKTTRVSIALRFGTISIRKLVKLAQENSLKYLKELIWREFYMMLLWYFPESSTEPFQKKYKNMQWVNDQEHFKKWTQGETGFPLVDAGMRELNTTGFMHNRIRMVTASFLCKQLLCDWRDGERYFAHHLNDYELSSNVGGWQWCAGIGADAAPYFRIFNPDSQLIKFDPERKYVLQYAPMYNEPGKLPERIVDLKFSRERFLMAYKHAMYK